MAEPKKRPDARPMRLAYAAGAVAAVSASTAGLVHFGSGGADLGIRGAARSDRAGCEPACRSGTSSTTSISSPGSRRRRAQGHHEHAPAPRIVVTHVAAPVHTSLRPGSS